MTNKDQIKHEISESFDFLRFLIKNPKEVRRITKNSDVHILCKDIPKKLNSKAYQRHRPTNTYLSEHTFHRV